MHPTWIQGADISALGKCAGLKILRRRGCPKPWLQQLTDISALGNCAGLKILDLSFDKITDINALGKCVGLKELKLDNCEEITDIAWGAVNLIQGSPVYVYVAQ